MVMGILGGSTRTNRPNRRGRGGRLLGATCGIIETNMGGRLLGHGRLIGIIRYFIHLANDNVFHISNDICNISYIPSSHFPSSYYEKIAIHCLRIWEALVDNQCLMI